jgi:hypothetical protein
MKGEMNQEIVSRLKTHSHKYGKMNLNNFKQFSHFGNYNMLKTKPNFLIFKIMPLVTIGLPNWQVSYKLNLV